MRCTFGETNAKVEQAFDKRERFEDDELDAISMRCAYLDALQECGWTQDDFEYRFKRTPFNVPKRHRKQKIHAEDYSD